AEDAHRRTRHYIRHSQLLQGMQRPALIVVLFATSLVVPPARAQGAAADTSRGPAFVMPVAAVVLAVRPVAALLPGGRLGPRVPPAVVAARWERAARALWRPGFGTGPSGPAPSAAAAPPSGPRSCRACPRPPGAAIRSGSTPTAGWS